MSKRKLEQWVKDFDKLSVKPLPWKYYVDVLVKVYGFEMYESTGSAARVFSKDNIRFTADEPHGREKSVAKYYRQKAIEAIKQVKLNEGIGNEDD